MGSLCTSLALCRGFLRSLVDSQGPVLRNFDFCFDISVNNLLNSNCFISILKHVLYKTIKHRLCYHKFFYAVQLAKEHIIFYCEYFYFIIPLLKFSVALCFTYFDVQGIPLLLSITLTFHRIQQHLLVILVLYVILMNILSGSHLLFWNMYASHYLWSVLVGDGFDIYPGLEGSQSLVSKGIISVCGNATLSLATYICGWFESIADRIPSDHITWQVEDGAIVCARHLLKKPPKSWTL